MEQQPLVSVIINCYNGEKYLREAIDSVIAQTYTNWEIIFWDNQSTDSTAEKVKSYKDERIRYFYAPEHTPLGEARNLAMKEAKGEYITFLDSDDMWYRQFLESAIAVLEVNRDYGAYYSNGYNLKGNEKSLKNSLKSKRYLVKDIIKDYRVDVSGCVIRASIVNDNNIVFNNKYQLIEDYDFYIKIAHKADYFYDGTPLIVCRIHLSETYKNRGKWYYEFSDYLANYKASLAKDEIDLDIIRCLQSNINRTKIGKLIDDNNRIGLLAHFVKFPYLLKNHWKKLLFIVVGKETFVKMFNERLQR